MIRLKLPRTTLSLILLATLGCGSESARQGQGVTIDPAARRTASDNDGSPLEQYQARAPSGHVPESVALQEKALQLLEAGDVVTVKSLYQTHFNELEASYGKSSRPYAWAQMDYGALCFMAGQESDALTALRKASEVEGKDKLSTRDRLTFLMNLGDTLEKYKHLDEAEKVHREGVKSRKEFYPQDHPGYAYGLESLASVLIQRGKVDEAARLMKESVDIMQRTKHPRLVTSLALLGHANAKRKESPLFPSTNSIPEASIGDFVEAVIRQVNLKDVAVGRALMDETLVMTRDRLGDTAEPTVQAIMAKVALERAIGDYVRLESLQCELLSVFEERGDDVHAIQILEAIAGTQESDARFAAACQTRELAQERAEKLGDAAIESEVATNYGLSLVEQEKFADARRELTFAHERVMTTGNVIQQGRVQVALGIFLQHQGEVDSAKPLLSQAVENLDPADTNGLCARSHLTALQTGEECGCSAGTMEAAVSAAIKQYVRARAPEGLIKDVVMNADRGLDITLKTTRQPTAEEIEILNSLTQHTISYFRASMQAGTQTNVYELAAQE